MQVYIPKAWYGLLVNIAGQRGCSVADIIANAIHVEIQDEQYRP